MPFPRFLVLTLAAASVAGPARGQDVNEKNETAIKDAVAKIAPSVVKIETSGGTEMAGGGAPGMGRGPGGGGGGGVRKGVGPTTGLIVAADGYVVTSAFNFANKPTTIFVTVPGRPGRLVAKQVATDTTRMLTLIKIDAAGLPVPPAAPKANMQIGQWAMAVGRTLNPEENGPVSISVGIISAIGRIWGKAVQTDAKVSPVNYGGPLVGIDGKVLGVLIPASSRGEGDTAGVEWYDSGIGFAVPLEDVFAVLPRLRSGKDLRKGLIGVTNKSEDTYNAPVVVGVVSKGSAAEKAGIKPDDTITRVAGKPVANFSQLQHVMGPLYEGDAIAVTVARDGKSIDIPNVVLTGEVATFENPFLGLLPIRDDPEPGVEVRYIYPKSPAEVAGLKIGDRIMKFGFAARLGGPPAPPMQAFSGRAALVGFVTNVPAGQDAKFEVKRKDGGKTETLTLKLGVVPEAIPDTIPTESTASRAGEAPKAGPKTPMPKAEPKKDEEKKDDEKKEIATGLIKETNPTLGREYWAYVPKSYKPGIAHGVIVWLHPQGQGGKDAEKLVEVWQQFCEDQHYILVGPKSLNAAGWVASETEAVMQDVNTIIGRHTVDRNRVIAHGMGVGGQMAFYLGFNARDAIRGVATTGAALGNQPKDNLPNQPLSFFVVGGQKDPLIAEIDQAKPALAAKRFPVVYRSIPDFGKEYMDQKTLIELCIWMDSLDKI